MARNVVRCKERKTEMRKRGMKKKNTGKTKEGK